MRRTIGNDTKFRGGGKVKIKTAAAAAAARLAHRGIDSSEVHNQSLPVGRSYSLQCIFLYSAAAAAAVYSLVLRALLYMFCYCFNHHFYLEPGINTKEVLPSAVFWDKPWSQVSPLLRCRTHCCTGRVQHPHCSSIFIQAK